MDAFNLSSWEDQMNVSRRSAIMGGLSFLSGTSLSRSVRAELGGLNLGEGLEDFWLATDAYIFGYPLVTMEMTRRVVTNVATPEGTPPRWGNWSRCANIPMLLSAM
jgi:hypothetical protein